MFLICLSWAKAIRRTKVLDKGRVAFLSCDNRCVLPAVHFGYVQDILSQKRPDWNTKVLLKTNFSIVLQKCFFHLSNTEKTLTLRKINMLTKEWYP